MDHKKTHFASAARKSPHKLKTELEKIVNNALVSELLYVLSGVVMLLNDDRQILTANQSFLEMVGIDSPHTLLGFRPGEILECVHAHDNPNGCGTGETCASCGAALAIVTSLCTNKPVERTCALKTRKNNVHMDLFFRVIATPIQIPCCDPMVLVCLQDITSEHNRANLERVFYHDVNNLITSLLSLSHLLTLPETTKSKDEYLSRLQSISERLAQEVAIQQLLINEKSPGINILHRPVFIKEILNELNAIYLHHPKALNRRIVFPKGLEGQLNTDPGLLVRVLGNMITNALEASPESGEVTLTIRQSETEIGFEVWNDEHIPASIQARIFQRHFSTKEGFERGLGTFAMKLLGEKLLGGRIEFSSSPSKGTTFTFWLKKSKEQST